MRQFLLVIAVSAVLLTASCMNLSGSKATLKVYLTDAILPIEQVESIEVTIDRILLMSNEASVVVTDEATTVNLLDLVGSEIGFSTIQTTGTYDQLGLEISQATITVNGTEYDLRIVSNSVKYPFTEPLVIDSDTVLVLDFDLSRSVKVTGSNEGSSQGQNPTEYHMTPVVHLRHGQLYDIRGSVVDDSNNGISHALVALYDTDQATVVAATLTHKQSNAWQEGEFKLSKVKPGEYEIRVFKKESWQNLQEPEDIFNLTPDATKDVLVDNQDLNNVQLVVR